MNTKTVRAYRIAEHVPLRRFVNDRTFIVALASPRRRNSAPRAVGMSSTFCSKDVIRSRGLYAASFHVPKAIIGPNTPLLAIPLEIQRLDPQPLEHRMG